MTDSPAIYYDRPDALGLFLAAANGNYGPGIDSAITPLMHTLYAYANGREVTPVERVTLAAVLHNLITTGGGLLRDLATERGETPDAIVADANDYAEARIAEETGEAGQ